MGNEISEPLVRLEVRCCCCWTICCGRMKRCSIGVIEAILMEEGIDGMQGDGADGTVGGDVGVDVEDVVLQRLEG